MKALKGKDVVGTFPTSVTQKRCWFMEQIHPGNRGLNLAVRWELRGPVSDGAVEMAFQRIVDRHEILRTRFVECDGDPIQEVFERVDFKLDRVDITNVDEDAREEKIKQIAVESVEKPFDLSVPCLLRVTFVQMEPNRAALLISIHNSIFDGYSIGVLGHELGAILEAQANGSVADVPELALQYGDFAMWMADYEASGALAEEEAYWIKNLRDMSYFELPADRPRSALEPESRSFGVNLPSDFEDRLSEAAMALDTSVFALGTAAFSAALERFTGRQDVSFAVQVAGRNEVDLEAMIGIFTNPIVLRFDVNSDGTLADHSRDTRDIVNGALAHQTLPFDKLVQVLNPPRDPLRIPLVSIMFNLQRAFLKERSYGPIELVSVQSHSPGTLYDLNVNIVGRNAGWRMVIDYNARLFDEATIQKLSELVVEVFETLMYRANTPITQLCSAPISASVAETMPQSDLVSENLVLEPLEESGASAKLTKIWSEVLDLPPEQVRGNFFDLGGYSVLALRMLAKVGEEFDKRPSLHSFLGDSTIAGLAGLLETPKLDADEAEANEDQSSAIWELVELRNAKSEAPVLLTINQPFMYQALAREMKSDCAVANVGVPGDDQISGLRSAGFDAAVDDALKPILARYAGRPLLLCGLCVDGRVALRLAQRLQEKGQNIAYVAMIDTWAPGAIKEFSGFERWRDRWRIRFRRIRYYLKLRRQGEIGWRDVMRQNDFVANILGRLRVVPKKNETEKLVDETVDLLVQQTRSYKFTKYDGEVGLFVTRSQGAVPRDGVLGWSKLLSPDVSAFSVNGWHGDALMRSGFDRIIGVLDAKARRLNTHSQTDE